MTWWNLIIMSKLIICDQKAQTSNWKIVDQEDKVVDGQVQRSPESCFLLNFPGVGSELVSPPGGFGRDPVSPETHLLSTFIMKFLMVETWINDGY